MKLLFDEDLVEAAVHRCASGQRRGVPPLQVRRYHFAREKLYSILDADERDAAFFQLHLDWFREWGVENAVRGIVREFPLLERHLTTVAFRKTRARNDEGAELFVCPDGDRNGFVTLRAERFDSDALLREFLRHEFLHVSDMVDPEFGYSPDLALPPSMRTNERLVRDRYRLLWDVTIDGRLFQRAWLGGDWRERRRTDLERAFAFWPEERRRAVFDELWSSPAPKHRTLLALASDPRNLRAAERTQPGAPCPLCGFPTFQWAVMSDLRDETRNVIRAEFPAWMDTAGLCARCAEVYEAAGSPGAAAC